MCKKKRSKKCTSIVCVCGTTHKTKLKKKAKAAATFFIHTATFVPALKISNLARARARRNK